MVTWHDEGSFFCIVAKQKPFLDPQIKALLFVSGRNFIQEPDLSIFRDCPLEGRTQLFPSSTSADDAVGRMYARVPQSGMVERLCLKLPDVSLVE